MKTIHLTKLIQVQTVNSNRIICSIRSKIDKDGLTKILDPTISRLVEKEMECLRTQENFQQQVRDIQTCVDLIPYVSYQVSLLDRFKLKT